MKRLLRIVFLSTIFVLFVLKSFSQTAVRGTIEDSEYKDPLIGASIIIEGTTTGTITDVNGVFELIINNTGKINLIVSYVGYSDQVIEINADGNAIDLGLFEMKQNAIGFLEINIIADRAKERETPVAFSTIRSKDIEDQLGSRDIPMILNVTPSVYATQQGGGAGDTRINVRGFDQRNVAIMINGVPINDMENGWVYWSNWDGIADATSSIQLQRGLSAVNLATPSIGGTMNILTSPAEHEAGGDVKIEYGSGNFIKTTVSGNTGLINDRFALSASIVRKVSDGVIDKTWTDAWAYYFGASFKVNNNHRLEIFAMGAPQRHGQNLSMQNVAAYSHAYAKEIGAADSTLLQYSESASGRLYNQNWNTVNSAYNGKQYWNGKEKERSDKGFINERENYYHKPLVNLNWYARWSDKISQYSTVYYSGGKGGGTGSLGSLQWDNTSEPTRIPDWNATIANNSISDTAWGILRNSVNNQFTIGALSRVRIRFTEYLKASVGIDWRTAQIDHFREVRDLLGGEFYYFSGNEFDGAENYNKKLGDKVSNNFTNTVDWIGYFAQLEYNREMFTAYGTFGNSFIKYRYTNHFLSDPDSPNTELTAESENIAGYQIKGGASYRFFNGFGIFGNLGYVSKAPIFDNVINDKTAVVTENPKNEIFDAFELGASYTSPLEELDIKANYYYTRWTDKSNLQSVTNQDGSEGFVFLTGMNQLHQGVEIEVSYQALSFLSFGGFASIANWKYTNDVTGTYKDYDNTGVEEDVEYTYYVKNLKVGDAPQTQLGLNAAVFPIKNLRLQLDFRHNSNYYANWDPFSRTDDGDREQVWKTPSYYIFDLHASYKYAFKNDLSLEVFGHIFNLLDEIYIQDALDNSSYNGFYGYDNRYSHTANSAEVFVGMPRTFNVGVKFIF
jgi:iron complex outermembrane recepter protein